MKVLATKKFEEKLNALDVVYNSAVRQFLEKINEEGLNDLAEGKINEILVYKIDTLRLFYYFTKDLNGEKIIMFLDLTQEAAPLNNPRNPRMNSTINPRMNSTINPRMNPSFNGYYFYDLGLNALEYAIAPNNHSLLFFDFSNELKRFAIEHSNKGYVVFDINNEWIGHLESNSQKGFNYFDINNEWLGFLQ